MYCGLNLLINDGYVLSAQRVETAKAILLATLADYHQSHSDQMGVGRDRLKRMALPVLSDSIVFPVIAQLLDENRLSEPVAGSICPDSVWLSIRHRTRSGTVRNRCFSRSRGGFVIWPLNSALMKPPPVSF